MTMFRLPALALILFVATGCVAVSARVNKPDVRQIVRVYAGNAPFAQRIVIPSGYETIRLPGMVADPENSGSAAAATYGDTERQADNVLEKIKASLAEIGASESDVVAMTVFLVAPSGQTVMDFDALNRAYVRHYGSPAQPNRPVRSTVQVAGLVRRGLLVEIEVTAARPQSDIALPLQR